MIILRWQTLTNLSVGSGSSMENAAVKLVPILANLWESPASPIIGYRTVIRTLLWINSPPRLRLIDSLDQIFSQPLDPQYNKDSLESKLFGLGLESYTVGSHEFYSNYCAIRNNSMVCLDMGHFHPTELVSSKLSSYLAFGREVMLHISRPVRWDSDHVVTLDDELKEVLAEIKRNDSFNMIHIGSDYFDASINRIAATVLGARNIKKALLCALLEPTAALKAYEETKNLTRRLIGLEEAKSLPFGLVWNEFCRRNNMPADNWIASIPTID